MYEGHRLNPVDRGVHGAPHPLIVKTGELQPQKTGDHVEIVLHPVVNLAKQELFLLGSLSVFLLHPFQSADVTADFFDIHQITRRIDDR